MAREPFNYRWAQGVETQDASTTFQRPDNIRLSSGWEGGADKDAPPAGQENWWHNRVDSALQGVERTGVMAYHPQAVYGIGAPTYGSDGNYYESLVSNNSGNNPVSTNGFWRFIGPGFFSGAEPGDIKAVAHNGVPSSGWIKCNGAVLLRSSYPRLFDKIGTAWNTGTEQSVQFRVPDFRGRHLRGFDDGLGVDAGRVFGTTQGATAIRTAASDYHGGDVTGVQSVAATSFSGADSVARSTIDPKNGSGTAMGGALMDNGVIAQLNTNIGEQGIWISMRPTNSTVAYWIKY